MGESRGDRMSAGLRTAQVIDLEELNQWLAQLEDENEGGFRTVQPPTDAG